MEIPGYEPFYLHSLAELRTEIERLGLEIPIDDHLAPLAQPLTITRFTASNRFCAQPIAGNDAEQNGAPGLLTRRRYRRFAEGGFGMIWFERTAAIAPEKPNQLCLQRSTLSTFRAMVEEVRAAAPSPPLLILQLAAQSSGALVEAAKLAAEAGFDGVDLQIEHRELAESLARLRETAPQLLLATRLCAYEAVRGGFGAASNDYRRADLSEPLQRVREWHSFGLTLLNVTATSPRLSGPERGTRAIRDYDSPEEHPLSVLQRQLTIARELRTGAPGLAVVGSGFSWLRHFLPEVAAGAVRGGGIDLVGIGRAALANPAIPAKVMSMGRVEPDTACMLCFACSRMSDQGSLVGCVLRDAETYGPLYREMRRFDQDTLLAGAARCHLCEAAPCVAASPLRTDIPAFIDAFLKGDEARSNAIIRANNPLPELTAQLSPGWLESEGACVEVALTGRPVPISDLQLTIAWRARECGSATVQVPATATGKRIAIVGGGPAGIAAATRLLSLGHSVNLYEKSPRLGGVAQRVLAAHRNLNPAEEIDALLAPAIAAGRLRLHLGTALGENLQLATLLAETDAVLLATGLWQERTIGSARGVVSGLAFLESADLAPGARVAVLVGGDSAMDAARAAQTRGAREIFIIFGGSRSDLHWHMPESWFATPGVHTMMNWQPLGYETDGDGNVTGVRLRHTQLHVESTLPVGTVIEAMGLEVADSIRTLLAEKPPRVYTAGALVNGGGSIGHCIADGLATADAIHQNLSA